jgi:hypothetical protein
MLFTEKSDPMRVVNYKKNLDSDLEIRLSTTSHIIRLHRTYIHLMCVLGGFGRCLRPKDMGAISSLTGLSLYGGAETETKGDTHDTHDTSVLAKNKIINEFVNARELLELLKLPELGFKQSLEKYDDVVARVTKAKTEAGERLYKLLLDAQKLKECSKSRTSLMLQVKQLGHQPQIFSPSDSSNLQIIIEELQKLKDFQNDLHTFLYNIENNKKLEKNKDNVAYTLEKTDNGVEIKKEKLLEELFPEHNVAINKIDEFLHKYYDTTNISGKTDWNIGYYFKNVLPDFQIGIGDVENNLIFNMKENALYIKELQSKRIDWCNENRELLGYCVLFLRSFLPNIRINGKKSLNEGLTLENYTKSIETLFIETLESIKFEEISVRDLKDVTPDVTPDKYPEFFENKKKEILIKYYNKVVLSDFNVDLALMLLESFKDFSLFINTIDHNQLNSLQNAIKYYRTYRSSGEYKHKLEQIRLPKTLNDLIDKKPPNHISTDLRFCREKWLPLDCTENGNIGLPIPKGIYTKFVVEKFIPTLLREKNVNLWDKTWVLDDTKDWKEILGVFSILVRAEAEQKLHPDLNTIITKIWEKIEENKLTREKLSREWFPKLKGVKGIYGSTKMGPFKKKVILNTTFNEYVENAEKYRSDFLNEDRKKNFKELFIKSGKLGPLHLQIDELSAKYYSPEKERLPYNTRLLLAIKQLSKNKEEDSKKKIKLEEKRVKELASEAKVEAAEGELGAAEGELGAAEGELGAAEGELGAAEGELGAAEGELGASSPKKALPDWVEEEFTEEDKYMPLHGGGNHISDYKYCAYYFWATFYPDLVTVLFSSKYKFKNPQFEQETITESNKSMEKNEKAAKVSIDSLRDLSNFDKVINKPNLLNGIGTFSFKPRTNTESKGESKGDKPNLLNVKPRTNTEDEGESKEDAKNRELENQKIILEAKIQVETSLYKEYLEDLKNRKSVLPEQKEEGEDFYSLSASSSEELSAKELEPYRERLFMMNEDLVYRKISYEESIKSKSTELRKLNAELLEEEKSLNRLKTIKQPQLKELEQSKGKRRLLEQDPSMLSELGALEIKIENISKSLAELGEKINEIFLQNSFTKKKIKTLQEEITLLEKKAFTLGMYLEKNKIAQDKLLDIGIPSTKLIQFIQVVLSIFYLSNNVATALKRISSAKKELINSQNNLKKENSLPNLEDLLYKTKKLLTETKEKEWDKHLESKALLQKEKLARDLTQVDVEQFEIKKSQDEIEESKGEESKGEEIKLSKINTKGVNALLEPEQSPLLIADLKNTLKSR